MKRYILLGVVIVVMVGWVGGMWYFRDTPEPTPPDPTPTSQILGPKSVQATEIVVYTAGDKAKHYVWDTIPTCWNTTVLEDGATLVVVFDSPGVYHVILASGKDGSVALSNQKVSVGGEGPDPPRPPPTPPGPPDPPDPPKPSGWTVWVQDNVPPTYSGRQTHTTQIASKLNALAAQIAAGAVKTPEEARVILRVEMNKVLGKQAKLWIDFSNAFRDRCSELEKKGLLSVLRQYRTVYLAMAKGFEDFVNTMDEDPVSKFDNPYNKAMFLSGKDRRPVVVIITSDGCPPCKKLKSEWLLNTKILEAEHSRIVYLDRDKDRKIVNRIATTGMKESVKVPQIQIIRFVDNKWQQFGKVGYTNFIATESWVHNVFVWEKK